MENNPGEVLVTAEKEGHAPREFTMLQLEAMGVDNGGKSYDGWKVTSKPKEPSEVTLAKKTVGGDANKPAAAKAAKAPAAKSAAKETPVKPLTPGDTTAPSDPVKPETPDVNGDGLPGTTL